MKLISFTFTLLLQIILCQSVFGQNEQKKVIHVVQEFFQALKTNDTLKFQKIFISDAYNYYVRENQDSVTIRALSPFNYKSGAARTIIERFRDHSVEVKIHRNIAMVWGEYDLWINDEFSHCGVDVFTLLKTNEGWKISSLSYSVEKERCNKGEK